MWALGVLGTPGHRLATVFRETWKLWHRLAARELKENSSSAHTEVSEWMLPVQTGSFGLAANDFIAGTAGATRLGSVVGLIGQRQFE